ncbi:MAG: hypothetical protein AB1439_12810, partial [candidate division FCPU426 bacterium]
MGERISRLQRLLQRGWRRYKKPLQSSVSLLTSLCFLITSLGLPQPLWASENSYQFNYDGSSLKPAVVQVNVPQVDLPDLSTLVQAVQPNVKIDASHISDFQVGGIKLEGSLSQIINLVQPKIEVNPQIELPEVSSAINEVVTSGLEDVAVEASVAAKVPLQDLSTVSTMQIPEPGLVKTEQLENDVAEPTEKKVVDVQKLKEQVGSLPGLIAAYLGGAGPNPFEDGDEFDAEDVKLKVNEIAEALSAVGSDPAKVAQIIGSLNPEVQNQVAEKVSSKTLGPALATMDPAAATAIISGLSPEKQAEVAQYVSGSGKLPETTIPDTDIKARSTQVPASGYDPASNTYTENKTQANGTVLSTTYAGQDNSGQVTAASVCSANGAQQESWTYSSTGAEHTVRKDFSNGAYMIYHQNECGHIISWESYNTQGQLATTGTEKRQNASGTDPTLQTGGTGTAQDGTRTWGPTTAQIQADIAAGKTSATYADGSYARFTRNADGTTTVQLRGYVQSSTPNEDYGGWSQYSYNYQSITQTYNTKNQLVSETDGVNTSHFSYDAQGRMTSREVSGPGTHLRYTYDPATERLTKFENLIAGTSMSYSYDSLGRITSCKDQNGVVHNVALPPSTSADCQYVFDKDGRVVSATSGGNTYTYDEQGRVTSILRADGAQITVTDWDDKGRAVKGTFTGGEADGLMWESGGLNQKNSQLSGSGTIMFKYNEQGLLAGEAIVHSGGKELEWNYYSYNENGELYEKMTLNQDNEVTRTYYRNGREIGSIDKDGNLSAAAGATQEDLKYLIGIYAYQMLGREAGAEEVDAWLNLANQKGIKAVSDTIKNSDEYVQNTIQSTYKSLLGRECSAEEMQVHMDNVHKNGFDAKAFRSDIEKSPEFLNGPGFANKMTDLYQRYWRRAPTTEEVEYWRTSIANGGTSLDKLEKQFMESPQYKSDPASDWAMRDIAAKYMGVENATMEDFKNWGWVDANGNAQTINSIVNFIKSSEQYVWRVLEDCNNKQIDPVHYVKPKKSGGLFGAIIKAIIQVVVTVVLTYVMGPLGTILAGAIFGAINAAQNGGNIFKGMVMGAAMAAATMVFSAVANAVMSAAQAAFTTGANFAATFASNLAKSFDSFVSSLKAIGEGLQNMAGMVRDIISKSLTKIGSVIMNETGLAQKLGVVGTALVMLGVSALANGLAEGAVNKLGLNVDAAGNVVSTSFSDGFKSGFMSSLEGGMAGQFESSSTAIIANVARTAISAAVEDKVQSSTGNPFLAAFASSLSGALVTGLVGMVADLGASSAKGRTDLATPGGNSDTQTSPVPGQGIVGPAGTGLEEGGATGLAGGENKQNANAALSSAEQTSSSSSSQETSQQQEIADLPTKEQPGGSSLTQAQDAQRLAKGENPLAAEKKQALATGAESFGAGENAQSSGQDSYVQPGSEPKSESSVKDLSSGNQAKGVADQSQQAASGATSATTAEKAEGLQNKSQESASSQSQTGTTPRSANLPLADTPRSEAPEGNYGEQPQSAEPSQVPKDLETGLQGNAAAAQEKMEEKLPAVQADEAEKAKPEKGVENALPGEQTGGKIMRRDGEVPMDKTVEGGSGAQGGGAGEGGEGSKGGQGQKEQAQTEKTDQKTEGTSLQDFGRSLFGTSISKMVTESLASGIQAAFERAAVKMYVNQVFNVKAMAEEQGVSEGEMRAQLEETISQAWSSHTGSDVNLTRAWQNLKNAMTYGTQQYYDAQGRKVIETNTFGDKTYQYGNGQIGYEPKGTDLRMIVDPAGSMQMIDLKTGQPLSQLPENLEAVTQGLKQMAASYAQTGQMDWAAGTNLALYQLTQDQQYLQQAASQVAQAADSAYHNPNLAAGNAQMLAKAGLIEPAALAARQALYNADSLTAGQEAQVKLSAATVLAASGQAGAQVAQALSDVKQYLNGLEGRQLTGEALSLAAKYDALARQTSAADAAKTPTVMDAMVRQLAPAVNAAAAGLEVGGKTAMPGLENSVIERTETGCVLTQQGNDGSRVSIAFDPGLAASRVEVSNAAGQLQQSYQAQPCGMELTMQRELVKVELPGGREKYVDALVPAERKGAVQTLAKIDGQTYVLTVGQDNQAEAKPAHEAPADRTFADANLPRGKLEFRGDSLTFTPEGGQAQTAQGRVIQDAAEVKALGLIAVEAEALVGKTAYTLDMPGQNPVTFIGSAAEIAAGNYYVTSASQALAASSGQENPVTYLAQYRNGVLGTVHVQDSFHTAIDYQSADLAKFTVTQTSEDGQRVASLKYDDHTLQGYEVEYKAFGVTLQYDARGNLTAENLQHLQKNSGQGYTFKANGQGFSLVDNATGFEQFFSGQGRALLNTGQGGGGGIQEVVEFDVRETVSFEVAKYEQGRLGSQTVRYDQIRREHALLQGSAGGVVTKTLITSDVSGTVNSRQVENGNLLQRETGTFNAAGELDHGTRHLVARLLEGKDEAGNLVRRENVTSDERLISGKVAESTMHVDAVTVSNTQGVQIQHMTDMNYKNGEVVSAATLEAGRQYMTGVAYKNGKLDYAATMTIANEDGKTATKMEAVTFNEDGTLKAADRYEAGVQTMTGVKFGAENRLEYAKTLAIAGEKGKPVTKMQGVTFNADGTLKAADRYEAGTQTMTGVRFGAENRVEYAKTLAMAGEKGKPTTKMEGVTFNADGTLKAADRYEAGAQTMTGVKFGAENRLEYAKTLTIAGEKGKTATKMQGVTFNADGTLKAADRYEAGAQTMTGVKFGAENRLEYAKTLTIADEKGKTATKMQGVAFNADGTLKAADRYEAGSQTMTGVKFGAENRLEYAKTLTIAGEKGKPATEMQGVTFRPDGKIARADRIEETIARQDVKNSEGRVVGEERGIHRVLTNAQFDEKGNLVSATQKVRIDLRTEFNAEKGLTIESRNIRSEARIDAGRVVESRTEVASVRTLNAHGKVVQEQFNPFETQFEVKVGGKNVVVQTTQTKEGSQVTLNGDKAHAIALGTGVQVTTDGKSLYLQDDRGVIRRFTAEGKETTGWFRERANNWHEFTDKAGTAWNTYAGRLVKLDNWVNSSSGVGQAAWRGFVRELGGVASLVAFGASTLLDAGLTLAAQTVGAVIGPTLEWSINVFAYPAAIAVYVATGKSLGRVMLDAAKDGIAAVFAPLDAKIQAAQGWLLDKAEAALSKAEMSDSVVGTAFWGAAAAGLKVLGENLPIVIILSLNALPYVGTALSSVLGTVLLAKDAVLHGLGHMFQSFFITPFNNISAGLFQMADALFNPQASAMSQTRQMVNAAAAIGNGLVGLVLAKQMLREPSAEAKGEKLETGLRPLKESLQARLLEAGPEGLGGVLKLKLSELVSSALKLPEGLLNKTSWGKLTLEDAAFNLGGNRVSIRELLTNKTAFPDGAVQVMKLLTAPEFRLSSLEFASAGPKAPFLQRQVAARLERAMDKALGREPQAGAGSAYKPLTQIIKPGQVGLAFSFTGTLPAMRVFGTAFIQHQVQQFVTAGRMIAGLGRWVGNAEFMQPITDRISTLIQGMQTWAARAWDSAAMRLFYPEPLRAAGPGVAQALRSGSWREAGSQAAGAFKQVGVGLKQAVADLPQALRSRSEAVLKPAERAVARENGALARTGMAESPADRPLKTESPAGQRNETGGLASQQRSEPAAKTSGTKGEAVAAAKPEAVNAKPESKSGAAGRTESAELAKARSEVEHFQKELTQARLSLAEARQADRPQAEINRLEQRVEKTEGALQRAQKQAFDQKVLDLQAQKQQAAGTDAGQGRSPLERAKARMEEAALDGEIRMTELESRASALAHEIRGLEIRAATEPSVKARLENLKNELEGLRNEQARQQQWQEASLQAGQAQVRRLELGTQLGEARAAQTEAAATPEARKAAELKARRIEKEMRQVELEQQAAEAGQRVLEFQAELARAQTTRDFTRALDKLTGAERALAQTQFKLAQAERQTERAGRAESKAAVPEMLRQAAADSKSGLGSREMRQGVEAVAKEQSPGNKRVRDAVTKAIAELINGKAADPAEALRVLERGTGSLQQVLESMARHGLSQQAQKILDQLCESRGIKDNAAREALARELGLAPEGKAAESGAMQALKEQVFGSRKASDPRYSADALDALRSLGADLKEGTSFDTALRRSGSRVEQAFRQLEQGAGKAAVEQLVERMTAEQLREVLTSSNPLDTLKNLLSRQQAGNETQGQAPAFSEQLAKAPGQAEALLQRMQQVQEAGAAMRQAVDKVNQARTYAERQAAQKQLARAEQRLTQMERLAGIKPEAGRRIPFTSEWRASRQAGQESANTQRTTYLKQQLNAVDNMRNLSPTERATLRELIQNELQILKLQGKQEGWLARRFESFRNRNASQMTSLYKARTQLVEALTTRTENGEKVYSNETVMKLLAAEGVSRGMMETAAV